MYSSWPMMEMYSRGLSFFNRWACHRPSCRWSSDHIWGLPRSMVEGKEKIKEWGPTITHPELYFRSSSVTCLRGDSHGILPKFYPPCIFIFHVGVGRWSPPKGLDLMALVFHPVNHGVTSVEACDHCKGSLAPRFLSATFWEGYISYIFPI